MKIAVIGHGRNYRVNFLATANLILPEPPNLAHLANASILTKPEDLTEAARKPQDGHSRQTKYRDAISNKKPYRAVSVRKKKVWRGGRTG